MSRRRRAPRRIEGVSVESLSHEGRGIARVEGKTVFIHGALPGERVDIEVTRSHRDYDEADAIAIHQASPQRVEPRCEVYGRCGGCATQHMSAELQLAFREQALFEQLERATGGAPATRLAPLTGEPWHYRRRARLGAKYVPGKGGALVGFRERLKYYLTDMRWCHTLEREAAALIAPLRELIGSLSIRERVPQIELAAGEASLALVLRVLSPPDEHDRALLDAFEAEHDVSLYLQTGGPNTVVPLSASSRPLTYRLAAFDVEFEFLPTDFVQVNAALNEAMVVRVVELLEPHEGLRVLDLFAGLGNFTLPLARRGCRVRAVEGERTLVARARENALRNGLPEVEHALADLFDESPAADWMQGRWDRVLLDPPRAGAKQVCETMDRLAPERIVYVSCNPATLARDAGVLVQRHGYQLSAAGVLDMFPQTAHAEAVAVFDRA
ncbi:MAG: 23S rRNA (uracil(1939)-C(5))-methyltransferase RlmD [Gammaproteobacteria bacterium]|nr:23S rRNA (uracil(1939)-C(5))-methyltransferase RlmD [Gammaproteobacteria bacterium]